MITISREWLMKTIAELEEERDATPGAVNEDAAMALAAMKLALEMLSAKPVYQCEFCHQDSNGELQWHWEDVNKDFYEQYDSERRGKRRVLYNAPPALETSAHEMLKRLANILSGSDAPGEICSLTVTAQSFVDRCKALAKERDECRTALLQVKSASQHELSEKWVSVPAEPTLEMVKAGAEAASTGMLIPGVYKAMLASAPQQEVKKCT
ncbi:TPA: hypothetical protein O8T83_001483 [Enterobacter cloacae]|nr:hypothetical protein [Enterobacter cloacae]